MPDTILVVEDERDLSSMLAYNLTREGFTPRVCANGHDALRAAREAPLPALVLLDLMLPDMPGTEVCRQLRADPALAKVPIVMVTARTEEIDRVVGFEVGADDYVTKPFSIRELMLRIRAVLRRAGAPLEPLGDQVEFGRLRVDQTGHRAWVDEQLIDLTALEFKLLMAFLERRGKALTREMLRVATWGAQHHVTARAVDTHVKRLRQKLGGAGEYIGTLRGVGYRMRGAPDEDTE